MPLNTFGAFSKPLSEAVINWSHPLAPRSRNGLYLPLNVPTNTPRDLVRGVQFSDALSNQANPWKPAGFPLGSGNWGLEFLTSPLSRWTAPGATNPTSASNNYVTMMLVYVGYGTVSDGHRPLSTGNDAGLTLEPCRGGSFVVLAGGVSHNSTGLTSPLNQWQFYGASIRASSSTNCVVYNYATGRAQRSTITMSAINSTNGVFVLGSHGAPSNGSNGMMLWGMIDYAYWSHEDMLSLAQNPFVAMQPARTATVFALGGTTEEAGVATIQANSSVTATALNIVSGSSSIACNSSVTASGGRSWSEIVTGGAIGASPKVTISASYFAVGRGGVQGPNPIRVRIDGVQVHSVTTGQVSWTQYTTSTSTLEHGYHTIRFEGVEPTNDLTTFIDQVTLNGGPTLVNNSFEQPVLTAGTFLYGAATPGWYGKRIISTNGSAWGHPNVPNGVQCSPLQRTSTMSQDFMIGSPIVSGHLAASGNLACNSSVTATASKTARANSSLLANATVFPTASKTARGISTAPGCQASMTATAINYVPAVAPLGTSKVFHFKFDENGGNGLGIMGGILNDMGFNDQNSQSLGGSATTQVIESMSRGVYNVSGSPSWSTDAPSISGNVSSLGFNGSTYISIPDVFGHPTRPSLTVSLWFRTTTSGGILGQAGGGTPGGSTPANYVPAIYVDTNGKIRSSLFWHGSATSQNVSSVTVTDGNWRHLVCTHRSVVGGYYERQYIDGVLQDDQYVPQISYTATYFYWLGVVYAAGWLGTSGGWMFFNGSLDDFRVYHTELTQADITSLASGGEPVNAQGQSVLLTSSAIVINHPPIDGGAIINAPPLGCPYETFSKFGRFDTMDFGF